MKTKTFITLLLCLFLALPASLSAAVSGRSEDTSIAGTEKVLSDSSGTDTYILVTTLRDAMVLTGGFTVSGSSSWDFSSGTGTFKTSTGLTSFLGSGNAFSAKLYPVNDDAAALGDTSHGFSDLFLASGGTINFAGTNWVATHTSGILTVGTGDLRVTTAGTNTASVVTVGGTQTLTAKTLTSPVIGTGLTASGSASNDFSASTGAFKTSSGTNTFGGSSHLFAAKLIPSTDDGAALGDTTHNFSDLFLATGAVINFQNSNVVITHSSGILTMGTGELRITTAGTNSASVPTLASTSTLTNKTLTAPVVNGLTSSGSTSIDFSGNTGTFKTSTGASTFGGSSATFASTITPSVDDGGALGTTSLQWSDLCLATGAVIKFASTDVVLTHSTGILTMGTGELRVTTAGTNAASVPTLASTSTLTNKTLTSPVIGTGLTASGSAANDFSGSTGTFLTSSGANTIGGNTTSAFTFVQTSAAAAAFATGLAGNTNPVFRTVNNISSQATGISITGRAAAAGADITVLSSGTDESMNVEAKGAGAINLNVTATGAVNVGDITNPAFKVVHTSEGTGVSVTSAAAASGVAVAAISSGTDESMTVNAKGAGNLTLQGVATGNTIANRLLYTQLTEVVTATNVITAPESGSVFYLNSATEFVSTLPAPAAGLHFTFIVTAAPSGASYTVVTNASANIIKGNQNSVAGDAGDFGTADDTISFVDGQSVAGDKVEVFCDGTNWFAYGISKVAAGITFTQAN